MGKSIYTFYKERLIEIGGSNRCLYLKNITRRGAYDIGKIIEARDDKVQEFADFLWGKSNKYVFSLISLEERDDIARNIELSRRRNVFIDEVGSLGAEDDAETIKRERVRAQVANTIIEEETAKIKDLARELEEIERETGRREMYIGYPFVFGCIPQGANKTLIKAPLLLFPVKVDIIDESTVEISLNKNEQVHINHALVYAYAASKKLNIDGLDLEFDDIASEFDTVKDVIDHLERRGIKITGTISRNIFNYAKYKEPETKPELSLRSAAVLGRFPLSNSIYSDYTVLEKRKLYNDALCELLKVGKVKKRSIWEQIFGKKKRKVKRPSGSYIVKMLDFAQASVVRKVEEHGNMVIYGPPGTGKSQTIVNIIADALAKRKKGLVVSQKKAALDVVYNRLGLLSEKAMYITDETKAKRSFYERVSLAHTRNMEATPADVDAIEKEFAEIGAKIDTETKSLEEIYSTLNRPRMPFGLSLAEMYTSSYNIAKNSAEYPIYTALIENPAILALSFKEFSEAIFGIHDLKLEQTYYDFMLSKDKNPLIDYMLPELDILTISEVKGLLADIAKARKGLFNTAKYPYYRQVLAFYPLLEKDEHLNSVVRLEAGFDKPGFLRRKKAERAIKAQFVETIEAIKAYVKEYDCLHKVLSEDGYLAVIDNILRGNTSYIRLLHEALDNYISLRDVNTLLTSLDDAKLSILNFAYSNCKSRQHYSEIIEKLPEIRIYHELLRYEDECQAEFARLMDFDNVTAKIFKLKESQLEVAHKLAISKNSTEYEDVYDAHAETSVYMDQITKKQKFWPIRKTMEMFGDLVLALFPCWLLSPENVSNLLPLTKNMFDIVVFDEASQVFIENTIPTIYRGKTVVVAGDDKQLRPSQTFVKRYLGADIESVEDYSVQAALEVSSLLDLAVSRYQSANLTYHYRSESSELIDFSNAAFYNASLQISPNLSRQENDPPIVRHFVNGKWENRKNIVEANRVVELLKEIFESRKNNESIGIITFNAEQQSLISDVIDKECQKDPTFRSNMLIETHRLENGEDTGIFIKNLENVQGDERDIIIFSVAYAPNEQGKVYTSFGSLSTEGGENRLNVAITRARKKIYVITSIEPEDLKVDSSKHPGPKLLQKYLKYVRAVSLGKKDERRIILSELLSRDTVEEKPLLKRFDIIGEMKDKLEKSGYIVDTNLGTINNKVSLAIYDPDSDRYLVGVELDVDVFESSKHILERDVFMPHFLRSRGWTIERVWSRDWWLSPGKVTKSLIAIAEQNKKALK